MRVLLDCPPGWYVEPLRSGVTNYRDPAEHRLRVLVTSLAPIPADVRGWRMRELHALVPDDQELVIVGEARMFTRVGWPMRVVEAECRRGGAVAERWVAAFYQTADRIAIALVRAPRGTVDTGRWRDLISLLATAHPSPARRDVAITGTLSGK